MNSTIDPLPSGPTAIVTAQPVKRGWRSTLAVIAVLVVLWSIVMIYRWEIRSHWWAYRLASTESRSQQDYYFACLAGAGDRSLGAMDRLAHDPREEIRLMSLRVLARCDATKARATIASFLMDESDQVAGLAAILLAKSDQADVLDRLESMLTENDSAESSRAARNALVGLGRVGSDKAEALLLDSLQRLTDPNLIAQAADSLTMLDCREAVPVLIALLADHREITILPASQRSALRAIGVLQSDLVSKGIDPEALSAVASTKMTVASVAARCIELITDSDAMFPNTK